MKYVPWIAVCVLVALGVRQFFPRTETVTEFIRLPSQTIYDTVEVSTLDSVIVERFRDRPVFQTDTVILRDSVWVTRQDTLSLLPFSWFLTALDAGESTREGSLVAGVGLKYDGALTRVQTIESYPVTLGYVRTIRADSLGIHIQWGEFPKPKKLCGTGCKLQWLVGGLAAGVILWEVAR